MKRKTFFKIPKKLKLFFLAGSIYWILAIGFLIVGVAAILILFPNEPTPLNYTWDGILMFMAICAGLGWIIHGTGFLIVKVN